MEELVFLKLKWLKITINMNQPELNSERLLLRLASKEDHVSIHNLQSYPEVDEYNTLGLPENLEETIAVMKPYIENNGQYDKSTFAVIEKSTGRFIGLLGLKLRPAKYSCAEIWYKFLPDSWGKGYATEAVKEIITYCFDELKLHRVEAGCAVGNEGSIRVLEKVGMQREGRRRLVLPLLSGWSDNYEYAILENDWRN